MRAGSAMRADGGGAAGEDALDGGEAGPSAGCDRSAEVVRPIREGDPSVGEVLPCRWLLRCA
jgi:hypothetical protein